MISPEIIELAQASPAVILGIANVVQFKQNKAKDEQLSALNSHVLEAFVSNATALERHTAAMTKLAEVKHV